MYFIHTDYNLITSKTLCFSIIYLLVCISLVCKSTFYTICILTFVLDFSVQKWSEIKMEIAS